MKKTLIILSGLLVGFFILFSLLDAKGNYIAEKRLKKINWQFNKAVQDPKSVPTATYDRLAQQYDKFIKDFPDSNLVPMAYILEGRVYYVKQNYQKSREIFEGVVKKYSKDQTICAEALSEIGRTFTLQEDWKNVVRIHERILKDYPLTDIGMKIPIVLAQFYIDRKETEKAQKALDDAILHYKKLINQYPDSHIEFNAMRLIAIDYLAQKKWQEAVDVFGDVFIKFGKSKYMDAQIAKGIISTINTIAITQLKDYETPLRIYGGFIKKYPDHPAREEMERLVESLKVLKEKNIGVIIKENK